MLSNAYFLAKFRFDTAENEPAKNLQYFAKFANLPVSGYLRMLPWPLTVVSLAALRQRPQHVAQRVRRPPPRRNLKSRESCELRGHRKILRRARSRFPIPLRALGKFINETDEIDRPFSTCKFPNKTGYASRTPL